MKDEHKQKINYIDINEVEYYEEVKENKNAISRSTAYHAITNSLFILNNPNDDLARFLETMIILYQEKIRFNFTPSHVSNIVKALITKFKDDFDFLLEDVLPRMVGTGKSIDTLPIIDKIWKDITKKDKNYSVSDTNINIVKMTCNKLHITQKELAEMLGVQPTAISNWATGQIPKMAQLALELLLENKSLKDDLNIIKKAHEILHHR